MFLQIFVVIAVIISYLMIVHILYKGKQLSTEHTDNSLLPTLKRGMTTASNPHKDSDADIENSFRYHVERIYRKYGYDVEVEVSYDENDAPRFEYDYDDNPPPSSTKIFVAFSAFFRVLLYPYIYRDKKEEVR